MKISGIIIGIGILSLTACSPKYYVSNTQNVPLLSEKGEIDLTLAGSGEKVEFQGAYAVTEHLGLKANGGLFIPANLDNGNGGSGKFIELGAGYFTKINQSENWIFETYGIVGIGSMENHLPSTLTDYPTSTGKIAANLLRIGIQPNIGYKTDYFTIALSSRFVHLSYDKINGDLYFDNKQQTDYLRDHASNILIEPALTIKGGFERIKLQLQYGYSFNVTDINFRQEQPFVSLGLNFKFR
ncbi:MAG: hypothetical protein PHQ74_07670 [Crocinitomicaceae bacterium]|nr:hypothetical protein [Crocinitomicaceae bacterium]